MIRKLDDTRVGEYKTNSIMTYMSVIIVVIGIIGLFLLPITKIITKVDEITYNIDGLSPVNYLLDNSYTTLYGYCSILYIILFATLFLNLFLCLSIEKIGKGIYVKISKIIEFFMGVGCLVLHAVCVLKTSFSDPYELIECFFLWAPIVFLAVILSLISYFTTKKISIYD